MKDGTKTSELKVTIGAILAALAALGIISQQDAETTTELIFVAVNAIVGVAGIIAPAVAYTWSRTKVKQAHAATEGHQ